MQCVRIQPHFSGRPCMCRRPMVGPLRSVPSNRPRKHREHVLPLKRYFRNLPNKYADHSIAGHRSECPDRLPSLSGCVRERHNSLRTQHVCCIGLQTQTLAVNLSDLMLVLLDRQKPEQAAQAFVYSNRNSQHLNCGMWRAPRALASMSQGLYTGGSNAS